MSCNKYSILIKNSISFNFKAHKTIIRYLELFKQIYRFYSQLGMDMSPDNTYILNRMQFWRYLKDCNVHLNEENLTLMEFDRLLNKDMNPSELHCPFDKILMREFFTYNVLIAYHLYKKQFQGDGLKVSWCIKKLIEDNILKFSCNVRGDFYQDTRKTLNVLTYMIKAYDIYQMVCKKRRSGGDSSITMRAFINVLNDFKLIDRALKTRDIVEILASDNQLVYDFDNSYNLEFEITFLEFFEALIACALVAFKNEVAPVELSASNEQQVNSTENVADKKESSNELVRENRIDSLPDKNGNGSRPPQSAKNALKDHSDHQKELKRGNCLF